MVNCEKYANIFNKYNVLFLLLSKVGDLDGSSLPISLKLKISRHRVLQMWKAPMELELKMVLF